MRQYASFEKYLKDVYYNEIFAAVDTFIKRNTRQIDFYGSVSSPDDIKLDDFNVKSTVFHQAGGNNIAFNATVLADIIIRGQKRRDYEDSNTEKWFSVRFTGCFQNGLRAFITGVDLYSRDKYNKEDALTRYLVPYLYAKDLDKEAEKFLKKYYPVALLQPTKLSMDTLLSNMHLKKAHAPLPDNIFGRTYFSDARVKLCDPDGANEREEKISAGTITINPNIVFMRNVGSENNTIVHECIHWDRHHNFFELQKILNPGIAAISCEIVEEYSSKGEGLEKELKWMEWQANALAPRILVPTRTAKKKLEALLDDKRIVYPDYSSAARMELAILELSEFYGVSVVSAKMRAIEMGFDDAEGTSVYVNGRYYPAYSFRRGALKKNQTFIIDKRNALILLNTNPELRMLQQAGRIIYANGMVAINDPKYVSRSDSGTPILTDYALEHVDECCLVFDRKIQVSRSYDDSFYRMCFLCNDIDSSTLIEAEYNAEYKPNQNVKERAEEIKKSQDALKEIAEHLSVIPSGFGGALAYHMKRRGLTDEELEYRSGISSRMIGEYRRNIEAAAKISQQRVMALCIGLNLQGFYSEDLLIKAGKPLTMVPEQMLYRQLIYNHSDENLDAWNTTLREFGFKEIPR